MATDYPVIKRKEISYFEGINSYVGDNVAKKEELSFGINMRSKTIGYIEKRQGYEILGNALSSPTHRGLFYFTSTNASSNHLFRVSTVGATTSIYYLNTSNVWTALTGGGTSLSAQKAFFTVARKNLFMVNGTDDNRYIQSDGTTVVTSSTATGHLYSCPKAYKIASYKERLYVGDYYIGSTRYQNGIMFSSKPVGIVSLVDGDFSTVTVGTVVNVTDTKYIHATDTFDIYRGGTKIADITTTAKTETSITIGTITFSSGTTFESADEIWVDGTYTGEKIFRWADNPQSGIDVKTYDTFEFSGGEDSALTILDTIGNVLVISNKNNIGVWNNYQLVTFDKGIGCVSDRGYVKTKYGMFFMAYDGIYQTAGGNPELISAKVQRYFDGATKTGLEAGAMGFTGESLLCKLGTVTLYNDDGSVMKSLSNTVIEYNIRQKNWYVHVGLAISEFRKYISSTQVDTPVFGDATTGNIYKLFSTTKDNGSDIPMDLTTQNISLVDQFENISYPMQIVLELKAGNNVNVLVAFDNEEFYPLKDTARKGASIINITKKSSEHGDPRCRNIKIALREMSGSSVKVSKIAIIYAESLTSQKNHK